MADDAIVYGINPVLELIRAKRRKIKKIYLLNGSKSPILRQIYNAVKNGDIQVEFLERANLGNLAKSSEHQGVVALCEPIKYFSYKYFLENQRDYQRVLIINKVQDPHNLGAVIRSAYLFSFKGIILTRKNTVSITPAVVKASAGAIEYVDVSIEENLPQVILEMKKLFYRIISLDVRGNTSVKNLDVKLPIALVVGGEDAGLGEKLLSLSDDVVKIPIADESFSLNLSVSAAIVMHHLFVDK